MLKIIQKLFEEANFDISHIEPNSINSVEHFFKHESFFAKISTENKFDFFVVIEIKDYHIIQKQLQALLDDYFETIIKVNSEHGIDKNLSLVLLIEEDSVILEKNIKSFIYDLEEDPFDFKKNVILHTKEQLELLQEKMSSYENYSEQLQTILQDKGMFVEYKRKQNLENKSEVFRLYDIVSKIFIKLHFLSININPLNLANLTDEIESALSDKELDIRNIILSSNISKDTKADDLLELLGVNNIES